MPVKPNNNPPVLGAILAIPSPTHTSLPAPQTGLVLPHRIPAGTIGKRLGITIAKTGGGERVIANLFGMLANATLDVATRFLNHSLIITENSQDAPDPSQKLILDNSDNKVTSPDATADGRGGYSPSPIGNFWDGRLSSVTGLPVMTAITFIGTTYTALNGQQITIPDITFEMVMITMKQGKNIEKTEITGRDTGSVKEYIGRKDWDIQITAIVTASQNVNSDMDLFVQQTGRYPEENMEFIDLLLNAPIAIKILCPYIQKRVNSGGDTWLVIEDGVTINQVEGEYEAQKIIIPCVTDFPLLIQVAG